jgi:hypothetical protein
MRSARSSGKLAKQRVEHATFTAPSLLSWESKPAHCDKAPRGPYSILCLASKCNPFQVPLAAWRLRAIYQASRKFKLQFSANLL